MLGNDELNLEMIPQGSLNHISIEPTLHDSIIMAQLHDEGIKIIKEKLIQGEAKYKCRYQNHQGKVNPGRSKVQMFPCGS